MRDRTKSLDDFLLLLKGVRQEQNGQFMALCPGHDDRKRSLSIKQAEDKLLIKCFAGCEIADILKPLNLTARDLFFNNHEAKLCQRKIKAIYHYIDARGKPFEIVRTRPKGFYSRRPDGKGGYINNLKGIVPTLYRQDELPQAIGAGPVILIPEGEKDVDRLRSEGFTATCNPMGAGKWRDGYSQALKSADLVIIPDNDGPGRDHAAEVAHSCYGKAARIRLLELRDGKDVSEWLDNGHTAAELMQLASQCLDYEPSADTNGLPPVATSLTDLGNAERLVKKYGDIVHYCYERNRWLVWSGKVWEWDNGAKIKALAKLTVRSIYNEAANEPDEKTRKTIANHARYSESDHRLTAMINLAQSEPRIPVKVTELDTNPWLFNALNGTVDLTNGQLLPHHKQHLLAIMVPVDYDPNAQCPRWLSFLDWVTDGNAELRNYLQRAVGYSLTGNTKSQVLFFLYGLGNNGKSTFVTTIRKLTGEYGDRVNTDLFMLKDKNVGGPREGLANLKGKRYVVASELEDGRRLAVSLIKDLTGGETIKADRKYEHEIEYQPTHKLWLVGNHKPVITDTTLSIWRRVKLIPFAVTVLDKEIDPDLPSKLEAELPGILAWAVRGCLDWQKYGLREPDAVTTATASYRHEQDIMSDFIEDCCILNPLDSITKADLKDKYHKWCQDCSIEPVSQRTFKARLMERGITEYKGTGGQRFWHGIRSKNDQDLVAASGKISDQTNISGRKWRDFPGNSLIEEKQKHFMEETATLATLATNDDLPEYPHLPCPACESSSYWLREASQWGSAEWLCSRCHSKPQGVKQC